MPSGESEHPLRADPLQALPDAVHVPRRPRPRAPRPPSPPSSSRPSPAQRSADVRALEADALSLISTHPTVDDPLLKAVVARTTRPPSPPAGHAFATDMTAHLSAIDDPSEDEPLLSAGIVERSDVSLIPCETEPGGVAGVYVVRSRRNWAEEEAEYYSVKRSIADFAWLEARLTSRYEGVIVPPLPEMALMGRLRYGYAYEKERGKGLERFLRRVATHPVLSTGEEVLAFFGASGEENWGKIRREPISTESSITTVIFGGGKEVGGWERLGSWGEKVLWQTGRRLNKGLARFLEREGMERREDSSEARLERLQSYVKQLGIGLGGVRQAVNRVVKNREMEMRGVASLQEAMRKLGEGEGGRFGSVFEEVTLDIGDGIGESGEEVFRDYEERVRGAQRIMNARREEQDAYEHALAVYTKLRDQLEKQTGSMWESAPKPSEGMDGLVDEVAVAARRLADVRRRYQAVAVSTTDELRRLRADLHGDLCEALIALATEFAQQHLAHAQAWEGLAKQLEDFRQSVE